MKSIALACTTSVLALISLPAAGQEQSQPAPEQQSAPQDAIPVSDIVVTGSRIAKDGSQAPTPVTAVTSEALVQAAPSNIPDALNKLPIFANSSNQNTGATFAATAAAKGNYLNLRALGPQRLLTLLNGSRVVPTTNTNAVDSNMLPQLLVSRVDVVTGGASAVYGSDAVTGVVNYILDDKFKGFKAVAQSGISDQGDDFSYRYGAAFGFDVGERFHLIGSYEHYKSAGIPSLKSRGWSQADTALTGAGTTLNPFVQSPHAVTSVMSYGGLIATGALAGQQFRPDGSLAPFNLGQSTGSTATKIGGDGVVYDTSMAARLKTDQAFLRGSVDLTDSIEFFVQGIYGRSASDFDTQSQNHRPASNRTITIFAENPYLRPEVAAQITGAGQSSFTMGRFFSDIPLMHASSVTTYVSAQAGLKGDFGSNWKWDVNYVHGRSKLDFAASEFDARNFFASVDAVRNPANGQIVCRVTLTNPTFLPGCVPMNVLGSGNITADAYDWARSESRYKTTNKMDYVNANISGDIFNLPAGPVSVAIGAEYRHQTLDQTSNGDPASVSTAAAKSAYFGDIRGVPSSALKYLVVNVGLASGSQTVKEIYGELQVPVFKDQPFAQNLDLNFAARGTDYKTSGSVVTWKAGLVWVPTDGVRIRASQSRDIAAPGLYDLYAGANVRNLGIVDPLTNTLVVPQIINQGNIDLKPEVAKTTTLGVVFQPVRGLTLSVDAYRIRIKGAIQNTSETAELAECNASGGTAPVCDLIIRPFPYSNTTPANAPTQIFVLPQNLAALNTQGIDFEASYTVALDDILPSVGGTLSLRAFANYLDKYETQASASQPVLDHAGKVLIGYASPGLPKWRGLLTQSYAREQFTFSLNERFTGSYKRGLTEVFASDFPLRSPNRTYVDMNVTYDIGKNGSAQVFLNVQNLFDVKPPVQQFGGAAGLNVPTDTAVYDIVGRYFTGGVRVKF